MQVVKIQDAHIPVLGFGTYGMGRTDMMRMIPAALRGGFRHIDTAQIYRNEQEVGECVASAAIPRREIFITTKVWVSNYPEKLFVASVDESLKKLQTDYIDLLLLHWPSTIVPLAEQIGALNSVIRSGRARHIGVSNFNKALMTQAVSLSEIPLVTNQVEYHPFLNQKIILEAARNAGLSLTAYCGMALGQVLAEPALAAIAGRHGRSIAQVVLRWLIQQPGVIALSRTTNPSRIAENLAVFDFELEPEEMAAIHELARPGSRIVSPPGLAPQWDPTS